MESEQGFVKLTVGADNRMVISCSQEMDASTVVMYLIAALNGIFSDEETEERYIH